MKGEKIMDIWESIELYRGIKFEFGYLIESGF